MTTSESEYTPVQTKTRDLPQWLAPSCGFSGVTIVAVAAFVNSPFVLLIGGWLVLIAVVL